MAKPYRSKEAQAALLHERGQAAMSDKNLLPEIKESTKKDRKASIES